jgi:ribose/xylose/arabinose/galactoside ABC-type transport system permease subunit/ABC-type sugar transport system substrate-binding protein
LRDTRDLPATLRRKDARCSPVCLPKRLTMSIDRRTAVGLMAAAAAWPVLGQVRPQRTVALLFDSLISPFWIASLEAMRHEAARRGWSVLEAVSNMDDNKQYEQVRSMIQRQVDGIIIIHTDDKAVIPAVRAANAAHTPMVHFNRPPAPSDAYSVAVVADNRKLMNDTTCALIEIARRRGGLYKTAILLGDLGDANALRRREGFQDAVSRNGDIIKVVSRIATEWNADKAFAGLSNALQANPDINMLVTSSDFLTPQIKQALRLAGKWKTADEPGHILIAGFDGDEQGYEQLAAGYFDVDGVQNLDYEVELAFDALERMWAGEKPPKVLVDPGFVISRQNLPEKRGQMWGYSLWKTKPGAEGSGVAARAASSVRTGDIAATATSAHTALGAGTGWSWAAFIAAFLIFSRVMFSADASRDTLLAMLPLAILVVGQTLVLLVGQIDLSVTAVMAMGSVLSASVMTRHTVSLGEPWMTTSGIAACLSLGLAIGLFNGVCNALLRVPSFIVTLAVMMLGTGAAVWYVSSVSDAISIGGLPKAFRVIGYGTVAGVPISLVISGTVLLTAWYLLSRTLLGRWVYAIGHNVQAARISGVPVQGVTIAAFTASGACAALASIIYTSRIETGLPTLGQNMLLDIVGAAVIGGVSLFGGRGNILSALGGALFLSILDKSLQLLGLSLFLVLAIKGGAILIAASADIIRQRRRAGA